MNVIPKNEASQAVHAIKHHGKDQHRHAIAHLQEYVWKRQKSTGVGPASSLNPIDLTGSHPRILWTPERLDRARAWLEANPFNSRTPLEDAMKYVLTGSMAEGLEARDMVFNFDVPDSELAGVASDTDRWNQWVPVVVDWCWDLVSADPRWPAWKARYDFIRWTLRNKDWGSGWMYSSNYNWAYMANEINWAIATGNQELLDWTLDNRWQPFLWATESIIKGGVPTESSQYGKYALSYPVIPFLALADLGRDLLAETKWHMEAVYALIHATLLGSQTFPYGDDETDTTVTDIYHGDFMAMMALKYKDQPVGQLAQEWLDGTDPTISRWLEAIQ